MVHAVEAVDSHAGMVEQWWGAVEAVDSHAGVLEQWWAAVEAVDSHAGVLEQWWAAVEAVDPHAGVLEQWWERQKAEGQAWEAEALVWWQAPVVVLLHSAPLEILLETLLEGCLICCALSILWRCFRCSVVVPLMLQM